MQHHMDKLRYPIGKFVPPLDIDRQTIDGWLKILESFPQKLKEEVVDLSEKELEQSYRPEGWTIRQLVHHCADSHMNSLIRFKLALTEDTPTIKAYAEDLWAELPDYGKVDVMCSVRILEGLHERWTVLIKNLKPEELEKQFRHPESNALISLKTNIGIYVWHAEHHLAHIRIAKGTFKEGDHL